MTWDEFIRLPSRLWQNHWFAPRFHGFIEDYQEVRIAKEGTRASASRARVVWKVVVDGATHGRRRCSGIGAGVSRVIARRRC